MTEIYEKIVIYICTVKITIFMFIDNVYLKYRSGTVNLNTVNSNFHLIRSYCEIFFYHVPTI